MMSIRIDTKSLELVSYYQFNNIKLSFFASYMKSSVPLCTINRCCTVIRYSRVPCKVSVELPDFLKCTFSKRLSFQQPPSQQKSLYNSFLSKIQFALKCSYKKEEDILCILQFLFHLTLTTTTLGKLCVYSST